MARLEAALRVLILCRKAERPHLEIVADRLIRAGFEVVLDVTPHPPENVVEAAHREVRAADRVIVAWGAETNPQGTLFSLANTAARAGKLVLLLLDDTADPLDARVKRVRYEASDDEAGAASLLALIDAIKTDLPALDFGWRELNQSGRGGELFQHAEPPPPAPLPDRPERAPPRPPPAPPIPRGNTDDDPELLFSRRHLESKRERTPPVIPRRQSAHVPREAPRLRFGTGARRSSDSGTGAPTVSRPLPYRADNLKLTVRAPSVVRPAQAFLLQVWFFRLGQLGRVRRLARQADSATRDRGTHKLGLVTPRGSNLTVTVECAGLEGECVSQEIVWWGEPISAQFALTAPELPIKRTYFPVVRVFLEGVPITRHAVSVTADPQCRSAKHFREAPSHSYRKAFLSYASPDRPKVLLQAQAMRAVGVNVFQDVLDLEPGERWERRLYQRIADADLFMLFWSQASAASEWVRREAEFALECQRRKRRDLPEIVPVILDGPPPAPPPASLSHIHFDDPVRCIIAAYESR